jgi:hypothetical protein
MKHKRIPILSKSTTHKARLIAPSDNRSPINLEKALAIKFSKALDQ